MRLNAEHTQSRFVKELTPSATLGDVFEVDLPRDHLIEAVLCEVSLGSLSGGTSPTWVSNAGDLILSNVQIIANGNRYLKDFYGIEGKLINIMEYEPQPVGMHKWYFKAPETESYPLPAYELTSLVLKLQLASLSSITTGSPTSQSGTKLYVSIIERTEKATPPKLLIEKVLRTAQYGTQTGDMEYEHERAYEVGAYILDMFSNFPSTRSNTAFATYSLKGRYPEGEKTLMNEMRIATIRAHNQAMYNTTIPDGFAIIDFKPDLDTAKFTSLKSYVKITSAQTNAGLRILERYYIK